MGELADRFERLMDYWDVVDGEGYADGAGSDRSAIHAAIVALEDEVARRGAPVALVMADDEIHRLRKQLAAAERRADELLAAISVVAQRDMRCVGASEVDTANHGNSEYVTVRIPRGFATEIAGPLMCMLFLPGSRQNPELLERASLQLAEAYIKAKAEAEAATVTP